jgi:spoIIIJ-associated protein
MESAEASGKTVEDALLRALAKIGAERDEVEMTVLDEGRRGGLFGRGARDALVRVERLAEPVAATRGGALPDTRIPRGQQGRPQGRQGDPARRRQPRGAPRAGGRQGGGRFETPAPKLTEEDFLRAPRYDEETQLPSEAGESRSQRSPRPQREARGDREPRAERDRDRRRPREEEPPVDPDINAEEVDFAAHIVDDVLQLLEINADITIREPVTAGDGKGVVRAVIDISGDDLGLLIGRRGDTLIALQYLVNLIVTRRYPGRGGVTIDVEHYRHRREEQVVSLATRMADRVRQSGSPITLEPMSAAERRLVHIALADDPELETNSVGEGENRKVVISARERE